MALENRSRMAKAIYSLAFRAWEAGMTRTALVTGASSGLGRVFATELAARGYGLVLVARRAARLEELAAELRERHGTEVEVLPADLADAEQRATVEKRLESGEPVDLLVNNAGTLGGIGPFALASLEDENKKLALNVQAALGLTRAALPGMLRRRYGRVLNVSSMSSFLPAPGGATYAAAKAFMTSMSESLHGEVKWRGVNVTAVCPGFVRTELSEHGKGPTPLGRVLTAEEVVRQSLAVVEAGRPVYVPGRSYKARVMFSRHAPRALVQRIFYRKWGRKVAAMLD
jgi:short-subunit dehydrogenase